MIMHQRINGLPCAIYYRIMDYDKTMTPPRTPHVLGERWLARIAVRAIVARQRQRIEAHSALGPAPQASDNHKDKEIAR